VETAWGPGSILLGGEYRVLRAMRVAGTPPSCSPAATPRHKDDKEGGGGVQILIIYQFKKMFKKVSIFYNI
jgi:hypothetical protein